MRAGAAHRDSGLRRVSRITRWLVACSVAAVGVLSAVVAQALPGNSGSAATPGSGSGAPGIAAPPTTSPPTTSPAASSPSVSNDPSLQPAPAPVPTHHRSVARSGGS
jgi:hypothetical protein